MRKDILFSVFSAFLLLSTSPALFAEEAIKTSIILGDDCYDEDEADEDDCSRQHRISIFSDEDIEDDCWYDDTAGWPGLREDTWFRDLEH